MQPEQPIQPTYVAPPAPQQNTGGFSTKQKRLMMIVGVLFGLFVIVMILGAIFSGGQGPTETTLTSVSARNSELLRIIDTFEEDLSTAEGKSYATQAKILITSDNNQIIRYTSSQYGSSHSAAQVANTELAQTGNALAERIGQNNFDADFISTLQFEIKLNKSLLEQLSPAEGTNLAEITSTAILNANSLL